MAILNTGKTFTDGENVTAAKLNEVVNNANFAAGSVDNSTIEIHSGGYLKVKPGGIKSEELDTDSVVSVIETALTSEETTASIPTASPPSGSESGSDGFMSSADKAKLDGIAAGAEVNVQSDWNQTDNTADDFIKNKPTIGSGVTNLSTTADGTQLKVNSDTGNDASIPAATQSAWGAMTDEDKTKLDGIAAGAEVNVQADWNATSGDAVILNKPTITGSGATNLSVTADGTQLKVNSDTGNDASIPAATQSAWGAMTDDDKTKLDGVATNANNYSHPTGDGNLHVPATSTTNNGKVLTAGATAGSASWQSPSLGIGTNPDYDDVLTKTYTDNGVNYSHGTPEENYQMALIEGRIPVEIEGTTYKVPVGMIKSGNYPETTYLKDFQGSLNIYFPKRGPRSFYIDSIIQSYKCYLIHEFGCEGTPVDGNQPKYEHWTHRIPKVDFSATFRCKVHDYFLSFIGSATITWNESGFSHPTPEEGVFINGTLSYGCPNVTTPTSQTVAGMIFRPSATANNWRASLSFRSVSSTSLLGLGFYYNQPNRRLYINPKQYSGSGTYNGIDLQGNPGAVNSSGIINIQPSCAVYYDYENSPTTDGGGWYGSRIVDSEPWTVNALGSTSTERMNYNLDGTASTIPSATP
jgi:uncharacterized protein YjbJ (UPF0337 family)